MYSFIAILAIDYISDFQMQRLELFMIWPNKNAFFLQLFQQGTNVKEEDASKLLRRPRGRKNSSLLRYVDNKKRRKIDLCKYFCIDSHVVVEILS